MHDEACTHFVSMVDQTTLGHRFLLSEFGYVPRAGWQIDPFGHSSTQAALLSAGVGFDSLFFARIDYEDRRQRKASSAMEFVWQASPSLGPRSRVWTSVLDPDYGPLAGFCFDELQRCPLQQDIHDDEFWNNTQVRHFVPLLRCEHSHVHAATSVSLTLTCCRRALMSLWLEYKRRLLLTKATTSCCPWAVISCIRTRIAGAPPSSLRVAAPSVTASHTSNSIRYRNLDRLIAAVNSDGRVHARYSTPDEYAAAKLAANLTWPMKFDDFFPYSSNEHEVWR
jgi:alpha-mannosidase